MNVFVAYSGGTDSTYSALQYRDKGHTVTAMHAQFSPVQENTQERVAILEKFCKEQGINFVYLDFREEFWNFVVQEFCSIYEEGKTPNPCALCNPRMKFGLLREYAFGNGADIFVTGHYTQLQKSGDSILLYPAKDNTKDQSYFLSLVPKEAFKNVEFPLGGRIKEDVRKELRSNGVIPPFPSDSQEICFIPNDNYREFLQKHATELSGSGDICLTDGTVLGKHHGLWQYTEGQRKGLSIAHTHPLYVIRKDTIKNILYVGTREEVLVDSCKANRVNIFLPEEEWCNKDVLVRTRYRQNKVEARVQIHTTPNGTKELHVTYKEPQEAIAYGQVVAVYNEQGAILAGGILVE